MSSVENLKIIFLGTPEFGAVVLERLVNNGYKPVLVITAPDKPVGRKQILTSSPVKVAAQKLKLQVFQPLNLNKSTGVDLLRGGRPDLIVVAAYGQILPKEILDIPKFGCLNVHPSLLPKYRGPSPIQAAIFNGDAETGVSVIKMTEKADAGEIVSSIKYLASVDETYETLHNELANLGAKLLVETIPDWVAGKIKLAPQDETKATYTKILKREGGLVDWKKPIDYIDRQVRALNPEPGTYAVYKNKTLKILKTEIIDNKLIIKEVQLAGKKPMSFEDFQRGHGDFKIPC